MKYTLTFMATAAIFTFSAVGNVQAEVMLLDGSYAELCADAASHIDDPGAVVLTGSRLATSPLELCTIAIGMDSATRTQLVSDYINRGVIHFAEGSYSLALDDFDMAISLQEDSGRAHLNRAYTLVAMQRWEESIESFDLGIALGVPELERAYFNRAIAHEETGNLLQAYRDYQQAAALAPDWEEPGRELGRFRLGQGSAD